MAMSEHVERSVPAANDNDPLESSELIDRLRSAALGEQKDRKSSRSAQLAFDTSVALETRLRVIAQMTAQESVSSRRRFSLKGAMTWLPISLGILAVMALGAMLTRRLAEKPQPTAPTPHVTPADTLTTSPAKTPTLP